MGASSSRSSSQDEFMRSPMILELTNGKVYKYSKNQSTKETAEYFYHPNIESLESHPGKRGNMFFLVRAGPNKDKNTHVYFMDR